MKILFRIVLIVVVLLAVFLVWFNLFKDNNSVPIIIPPSVSTSTTPTSSTTPSVKDIIVTSSTTAKMTKELIIIDYNGTQLKAYVYKPADKMVDVVVAYHGTVNSDSQIITAAKNMADVVASTVKRDGVMIISVAYPQHAGLFGDNIKEAEAALLWVKNNAAKELGVTINKIFMVGHSQGGYMVTRLNTMQMTDGVVANGAGPLDLSYRCGLDEKDTKSKEGYCVALKNEYGSAFTNPNPYIARSLISFTTGYKAKILFTQGMKDGGTQIALWPKFKQAIGVCTDCAPITIKEIPNGEHGAGFSDAGAIQAINDFLR